MTRPIDTARQVRTGAAAAQCVPVEQERAGFREFVHLIVAGDIDAVSQRLAAAPQLATAVSREGATRGGASAFFFADIAHYLYEGDTALHMAAAAFQQPIVALLVTRGADCRAVNRRGAQPLHYAADTNHWQPDAQAATIDYLAAVGADPNAADRGGATPLHRAVRTRSVAAVLALLDAGADPRQRNASGSMPLHLAVQTTGRGGAGSERAQQQQAGIIRLLLERGARVTDRDGRGRTVRQSASGERIRVLLAESA